MLRLRKFTKTIRKYVALSVLYSILCGILLCVTLSRASRALKDQYSNS